MPIADGYITNLSDGSQVKYADAIELNHSVIKYHPATKETFVLFVDGGYKLAKLDSEGALTVSSIFGSITANPDKLRSFSFNYDGDKILMQAERNGNFNPEPVLYYINTSDFSVIKQSLFRLDVGACHCIVYSGDAEIFYVTVNNFLYRVDASILGGGSDFQYSMSFSSTIDTLYTTSSKLYLTEGTNLRTVQDNGMDNFINNTLLGDLGLVGKDTILTNLRSYTIAGTSIVSWLLDGTDKQIINLAGLSILSTLSTEVTTNRVLFSATDTTTNRRNDYELLPNNTSLLVREKTGDFGVNTDRMGGLLDNVTLN